MTIKNQNILVTIFCILLLATVITTQVYNWKCKKSEDYEKELYLLNGKNDSLNIENNKLVVKLDSLKKEIAVVDTTIVEINNWYEKKLIDIVNQPIAADVKFFTEYLSENNSGFSDSNNSTTAKAD